jgi:lysophospholipase L1-like esterase
MHICVFGDSIAWGAFDYEKGGWVERLKTFLMESEEDVMLFNLGVHGDNTEDLVKRFHSESAAREPDLIVFAIGINDSQYIKTKDNPRVSLKKFVKNISKLAKMANKFTEKIIFVGLTKVDESKTMPLPWDTDKYYDNESIVKYNDALGEFCEKNSLMYADMRGVVEIQDLEDGLHPNAKGHEKMFEKLRVTVEGLID